MAFKPVTLSRLVNGKAERQNVQDQAALNKLLSDKSNPYKLEVNLGSNKGASGYQSIYESPVASEKGTYYGLKDYVAPPSIVSGNVESPLSSSTGVLDEVNKLRKEKSALETSLSDYKGLVSGMQASSAEQNGIYAQLKTKTEALGSTTSEEERQIEEAGINAGLQFEHLIQEAQGQKEQGFAKSQVNVGESGGLMNTQLVGNAADPRMQQKIQELRDLGVNIDFTGAAPDWAGKGGELERVKSVYDNNISQLQAKKQSAILAAKDAMRTAIRTGKEADLKAVSDLYETARQAHADANNLILTKQETLTKMAEVAQASIQSAYANAKSAGEYGGAAVSKLATSGVDIKRFTPELKKQYETELGLPFGSFDTFYKDLTETAALQKTGTAIEIGQKLASMLENVPENKEIDILGTKYRGLKSSIAGSETTADYKDWLLQGAPEGDYGTWKRKNKGTASGLPNNVISQIDALSKGFEGNQIVKDFVATSNKKDSVNRIVDMGVGGPGDLAVVFEFMKALDPTSVVRETEYQTAAKSGNIFAGALAQFNGYFKETGGFLPDNVKQAFKQIVDQKYQVAKNTYDNLYNEKVRLINNKLEPYGEQNGQDYLVQYNSDTSQSNPANAGSTEDFFSDIN